MLALQNHVDSLEEKSIVKVSRQLLEFLARSLKPDVCQLECSEHLVSVVHPSLRKGSANKSSQQHRVVNQHAGGFYEHFVLWLYVLHQSFHNLLISHLRLP